MGNEQNYLAPFSNSSMPYPQPVDYNASSLTNLSVGNNSSYIGNNHLNKETVEQEDNIEDEEEDEEEEEENQTNPIVIVI